MTHAYPENYLEHAQENFAGMLDFAVNQMQIPLSEYYSWFLHSDYARLFAHGDCSTIVGKSGAELAMDVYYDSHMEYPDIKISDEFVTIDRSPEYWTGWALSYYQWKSRLSFNLINEKAPIQSICEMYPAYHEMDLRQFVDQLYHRMKINPEDTRMKQFRRLAGYSQRVLSEKSDVPIRTIQQYEQRQKDINKAQAQAVARVAAALGCTVEDLLE